MSSSSLPLFDVTKRFTAGLLAGLTVTERTSVSFPVGREFKACVGGGRFVVESCVQVAK